MDIISAYREVGTYRGAAAMCATTPKTVKRVVARQAAGGAVPPRGGAVPPRRPRESSHDGSVREVVAAKVKSSEGRMSGKRLLPVARAAGYEGSARTLRRLVAAVKAEWRRDHHRGRRPGVWSPGEHLLIDWGAQGGLHICCAMLAWSRFRFVRFATNERADTTFAMLGECFEVLGGVPKVVLADRMGCLKGGVVANRVIPTPDYVRFATHHGFRPDFCEAHEPQSKGMVEHLVGYAKRDLVVPMAMQCGGLGDLVAANEGAAGWCAEVNSVVHSEIAAVPAARLGTEVALLGAFALTAGAERGGVRTRTVDRLSCVRFGSARYSVPTTLIGTTVELRAQPGRLLVLAPGTGEVLAEHGLVAPGEASVLDETLWRAAAGAAAGGATQECFRETVLRARPGRGGVHRRGRRGREHPPGTGAGRARRARGRPRAARPDRGARTCGRVRALARRGRAFHPGRRRGHPGAEPARGRTGHRPPRGADPVVGRQRHRGVLMTSPPKLAPGRRRPQPAAAGGPVPAWAVPPRPGRDRTLQGHDGDRDHTPGTRRARAGPRGAAPGARSPRPRAGRHRPAAGGDSRTRCRETVPRARGGSGARGSASHHGRRRRADPPGTAAERAPGGQPARLPDRRARPGGCGGQRCGPLRPRTGLRWALPTPPRPRPRRCRGAPPRARPGPRPARGVHPGLARAPPPHRGALVSTAPPQLAPDLAAGLRRLKLAAMRGLAPELLVTAKSQRWSPEELLRTLIEAEITARDASNARARLKAAAFPVHKTLDEFDVPASSIPAATFAYLSSLEWIRAAENLCLVGPPGTGKSHTLITLGVAAVHAGHRVRYFTAPALVETLYRGLADNSVGRVMENLLRADLVMLDELGFAHWTTPAPSCCSGSSPPPTNAEPWASDPTGPSSPGAGSCPNTPPPPACSTASCTTASSWSPKASPTACARPAPEEVPPRNTTEQPRGVGLLLATSGDRNLAIDSAATAQPSGVCPCSPRK